MSGRREGIRLIGTFTVKKLLCFLSDDQVVAVIVVEHLHWLNRCIIMLAATVTLSEAVPRPYWGMYTKESQTVSCFSDIPVPCQEVDGRVERGRSRPLREFVFGGIS